MKVKLYYFKYLSYYRTELMGIAMLFIIIFHTSINIDDFVILKSLKNIGDIGVDMFLLLSGLGLYFSYNKDRDKKRLFRIFPIYLPVAIIWYGFYNIISNGSFFDIFIAVTTLNFWIKKNYTYWFIASIICLYLITPFYLEISKKNLKISTIIVSIIFTVVSLAIRFTSLNYFIDNI